MLTSAAKPSNWSVMSCLIIFMHGSKKDCMVVLKPKHEPIFWFGKSSTRSSRETLIRPRRMPRAGYRHSLLLETMSEDVPVDVENAPLGIGLKVVQSCRAPVELIGLRYAVFDEEFF